MTFQPIGEVVERIMEQMRVPGTAGTASNGKPQLWRSRQIIQVEVMPETGLFNPHLVALCDDGTVWICSVVHPFEKGWRPHFPPIPQPDDPAEQ